MNGISGYQVYQNDYTRSTAYAKTYDKTGAKKNENGITEPKDVYEKSNVTQKQETEVTLSDSAQKLLERLQEKYGNMDFIVANYSSEAEAQRYLSGGKKEYSVLIEPELLEEMAADEETEQKYTSLLDEATAELSDIRESLQEEGVQAAYIGVSVGKDGSTTFYAELDKVSEKQRERIEKTKSEKKEKTKKEEKAEEKEAAEKAREEKAKAKLEQYAGLTDPLDRAGKVRVSAGSAEELLEKIRHAEWDKVMAPQKETVGSIIDYGI